MALGTRKQRVRQETLWIAKQELPASAAHPFYTRLNELLEAEKFDEFAEAACQQFYAKKMGRPSLTPGIYFRALLVGYFEGIDSERGIAWRATDSLGVRHFLGIGLDERSPDHSTLSRTRRLIAVETHEQVFGFVLRVIAARGLLKGKTIGVDATTLEANAAMRSIVRRDTGDNKDVKLATLSPQAAAQAFVAGQNDAAMTYEPYLSTVRNNPQSGKIMATTLDYPMVMDTVGCSPDWLKANPRAAQGLANAYFDALELIKTDPARANEIMGAAVKQTGEAFAKSASFLRWQDKAANQKFFAGELQAFMKDAAAILLEAGVIRRAPTDFSGMFTNQFIR